MIELLNNGVDINKAKNAIENNAVYEQLIQKINSTPNSSRDFLNSENYSSAIKKATQGKYQKELMQILDLNNMSYVTRKSIIDSGLSEEELIDSIKKLSKSTYKLAMNTPNQYLSNIDIVYTTKINDKLPQLSDDVLKQQQEQVTEFFSEHIGEILRALKYVDTDTINQMMDKRTELFAESLANMNNLTDSNYSLLSDLIKGKSVDTSKALTAREKIQLTQIVETYQNAGIDTSNLSTMAASGEINLSLTKQTIQKEVLKRAGITDEQLATIPTEKMKFNEEYSYLALQNPQNILDGEQGQMLKEGIKQYIATLRNGTQEELDILISTIEQSMQTLEFAQLSDEIKQANLKALDMCKNPDKYTDDEIYEAMLETVRLSLEIYCENDELYTVIRESAIGDFDKFITNTSNKYGQTNALTKQAFKNAGLDYEKWLSPDIDNVELDVAGKKMTIKIWDRNPQEDLFMGNKTTCCTAIGTGGNAGSTPIYLLNTSYNVVDLYDVDDNVVGMSRVFMGIVDDEPVLIMDNIELNNTYIKGMSDTQKSEIRDGFFNYMNQYAQQVTGNDNAQVYFYSGDVHVPTNDLEIKSAVTSFVGNISQETVYVNSAGCTWINPQKMSELGKIDWLVIPKNN